VKLDKFSHCRKQHGRFCCQLLYKWSSYLKKPCIPKNSNCTFIKSDNKVVLTALFEADPATPESLNRALRSRQYGTITDNKNVPTGRSCTFTFCENAVQHDSDAFMLHPAIYGVSVNANYHVSSGCDCYTNSEPQINCMWKQDSWTSNLDVATLFHCLARLFH
jgi:hypothetical protein